MKTNKIVDKVYTTLSGNTAEKVPDSVRDARLTMCKMCPKLMITGNCAVCGCFVGLKTEYKDESCPKGKW